MKRNWVKEKLWGRSFSCSMLNKSCQIFGLTWPKGQKLKKKYWRIFFFFYQDEFAPEHVVTEPDRGGTRGEELRELSAEEDQCENCDKNRHKKSQQHGPKGNSRIELSFPLIRSLLYKKQRMDEGVRSFERQMRDSLNAWTLDASLLERKVKIIELNNQNFLLTYFLKIPPFLYSLWKSMYSLSIAWERAYECYGWIGVNDLN